MLNCDGNDTFCKYFPLGISLDDKIFRLKYADERMVKIKGF